MGAVHDRWRGSGYAVQLLGIRPGTSRGTGPAPHARPSATSADGFEFCDFATATAYHGRDATASGDSAHGGYRFRCTDCDSGTVRGKSGDDGAKCTGFGYGVGSDGTSISDCRYSATDDLNGDCLRHRPCGHLSLGHGNGIGSVLDDTASYAQGHRSDFGPFLRGT